MFLPPRASNRVGVRVYIYMCIVIERTRDLIYLKFVYRQTSPRKSPSAGENSSDSAYIAPAINCSFCLVDEPLPDRSNNLPLCHTHYLTPDQYLIHSLFRPDPLPSRELETILQSSMLQCFTRILVGNTVPRKLNNKQRQMLIFVFFLSISILSLLPFSILSLLPLPHPFFLF